MSEMKAGPFSYRNWKALLSGENWQQIIEYPLFSDAQIVDEIIQWLGPYRVINNVAIRNNRPAIILQVQQYIEYDLPQMDKTQTEDYHGGAEPDEIAALLSLCLGIRMKAGETSRVFTKDGDPMGMPIGGGFSADPSFIHATSNIRPLILKSAVGEHWITQANFMVNLPALSIKNATALVRAARLYQEAIWIIENAPELSWIMFTSAIETVANRWRTEKTSAIEKMKLSYPELEDILRNYAGDKGDELVQKVAKLVAQTSGAKKTFIDFVINFLPAAPAKRPHINLQVSWEISSMRKVLSQIYDYRSSALHAGIPFPAPMCLAPSEFGEYTDLAEIPLGFATSTKGGVWTIKDTPILLHTFEYICRNAILNWWKLASIDDAAE